MRRRRTLTVRSPRWNLWLGLGFTIATIAFGFLAFATVPHDDAAHEPMTLHRNLALTATAIYAALGILSYWQRKAARHPDGLFVLGLVAALGLLLTAALAGAELVFRHGVGVATQVPREGPAGGVRQNTHTHEHGATHQHDHKH